MKGEDGFYHWDGREDIGVLDAIWSGVSAWYADGLRLHPSVFLLPVNLWRKATMEAATDGHKQTVIGIQEVMTPEEGKKNALVMVSPTVGVASLLRSLPEKRDPGPEQRLVADRGD